LDLDGGSCLGSGEGVVVTRGRNSYFWIYAALSAIVLIAPIRKGDLAGYDDANFSTVAKDIFLNHDWLDPQSNGIPELEHPPLFPWIQVAFFHAFGMSDFIAKLPSALCGLAVVLMTFWLARKLTGDAFFGVLAMFVMASSVYFIKYASRAMTDVPFTFFFLCSLCAWVLAKDRPLWLLAAGFFTGAALMTRGLMGFALPVIFVLDCVLTRRRHPLGLTAAALALAFAPAAAWYVHWIRMYTDFFFSVQSTWLRNESFGSLSPAWRKYTGAFEYLWMVTKSYWPWLPFMITGAIVAWRGRDRRLGLLLPWIVVVFVLCAVNRSRVLRYMLPAYPAFAILSAAGLLRLVREAYLKKCLQIATPLLATGVVALALFPPVTLHATETRPMALTATAATPPGERYVFYDKGDPRFDESNQLLWYGGRQLVFPQTHEEFLETLADPPSSVFVVDRTTYQTYLSSRPHRILLETSNLICLTLY